MAFDPRWDLVEANFSKNTGHYESLFTLANGYLGTRGATEEAYRDRTPGTYLAGLLLAREYRASQPTGLAEFGDHHLRRAL